MLLEPENLIFLDPHVLDTSARKGRRLNLPFLYALILTLIRQIGGFQIARSTHEESFTLAVGWSATRQQQFMADNGKFWIQALLENQLSFAPALCN